MVQAVDVIAVSQPQNRTAVIVRDMEGVLTIATQSEPGKPPEVGERILPPAVGRPVAMLGPRALLEVVFAAKDGSLIAAAQEQGVRKFQVHMLRAPKVLGNLASVTLTDRTVVTAQANTGELFSIERTDQGWSEPRVLPSVSASLDTPKFVTLDGRSLTALVPAI